MFLRLRKWLVRPPSGRTRSRPPAVESLEPRTVPSVLVWSDEFNGAVNSAPDPTHWSYDLGGGGWGNHELEINTNSTQNAFITADAGATDGKALAIRAIKQSNGTYTSARLNTAAHFNLTYGRFEIRAKLPYGQGIWPAFWMLGTNTGSVGWPNGGEIDVMENIGREPSTVHGTMHGPGYSGGNALSAAYTLPGGQQFKNAYHVFAVDWTPSAIQWSVDGHVYETRTRADLPHGASWVFDHSFFVILNLAVGGDWPGNPNGSTVFPQTFLIDYLRVYADIPDGWASADVGGPGKAGGAAFDAPTHTWTVAGGGTDIWGMADQFHFASEQWTGDGGIGARVRSVQNTNPWAKAGVMFRNGTAATDPFADMVITPGQGVSFEWRDAAGDAAQSVTAVGVVAPVWVKLTRHGNTLSGYYSADGVTWTQVGIGQIIHLTPTARVGLAVSAHDPNALNTSSFDNVSTGPPGLAPVNLTATAANGLVTLSWPASPGAAGYNLYRGTSSGGEGPTPVATGLTTTAFTDTGLSNGTTYYYVATAVNTFGEGGPSNEGAATPQAAAAFAVSVNFSNNVAEVPTGYINDIGLAFGDRGSGFQFGWNQDTTADARDRDDPAAPDERYDSFIHMQRPDNPDASWRIALPKGIYTVHVVAGDIGDYFDSMYAIDVQGTLAVSGSPTPDLRFFEGTLTVAVTNGLLTVSNDPAAVNNKIDFIHIAQVGADGADFSGGFAGATGLALNGGAAVNGAVLRLTDGGVNEARSVFFDTPVNVQGFTSAFSFQLTNADADGFTFTLQGNSPTVVGGSGGALGYQGLRRSAAIKFDLYDNAGEGSDSTGLYTGGSAPTVPAIDLSGTGIDLHSGDVFDVFLTYNGTTLGVTIVDASTGATAAQAYAVDLPAAVGGPLAYAGFTAGTGGLAAIQDILAWSYTPGSRPGPALPTGPFRADRIDAALVEAVAPSILVRRRWAWHTTSSETPGEPFDIRADRYPEGNAGTWIGSRPTPAHFLPRHRSLAGPGHQDPLALEWPGHDAW